MMPSASVPGQKPWHPALRGACQHLRGGRHEDAEQAVEEVRRHLPADPNVLTTLAWLRARRGDPASALDVLVPAAGGSVRVPAGPPTAYYTISHSLFERGYRQEAVDLLLCALRVHPDLAEDGSDRELVLAALAYFQDNDARMVVHLRRAVQQHPDSGPLRHLLALALLRSGGHPDEAAALVRSGEAANADDAGASGTLLCTLGDAEERCGRVAAAASAYRQALGWSPERPPSERWLLWWKILRCDFRLITDRRRRR
jgi:tetratricopeptide (TPR) repeat protein